MQTLYLSLHGGPRPQCVMVSIAFTAADLGVPCESHDISLLLGLSNGLQAAATEDESQKLSSFWILSEF
jgi:hypothetical protein